MTRDSKGWYWIIAGSVLTALASRLDLIDPLIPEHFHKQAHAAIELASMVVGIVAGIARMSPLPISNEGRVDAIQKNAGHADKASVAASVAAIASDQAAKASTVAVEAAQVAVTESEKASGIQP